MSCEPAVGSEVEGPLKITNRVCWGEWWGDCDRCGSRCYTKKAWNDG